MHLSTAPHQPTIDFGPSTASTVHEATESLVDDPIGSTIARCRLRLVREPTGGTYRRPRACSTPDQAARLLWSVVESSYQEIMGALLLDTRNRAIGHTTAYRGTLDRAAVEPRGLLVPALLVNASGLICFHTHPSGDPSPSAEDLAFTERLAKAGKVLGINLVDHIVLGEAPRYTSLMREGSATW